MINARLSTAWELDFSYTLEDGHHSVHSYDTYAHNITCRINAYETGTEMRAHKLSSVGGELTKSF